MSWEQNSEKLESKYKTFFQENSIENVVFRIAVILVEALMCQC